MARNARHPAASTRREVTGRRVPNGDDDELVHGLRLWRDRIPRKSDCELSTSTDTGPAEEDATMLVGS